MKMRGSLSEASPSPWPGTVDFLNLGTRVGLSLRGEAGAKRRVRVLSAWRRLWAPSIKILRRSAGKIAPRTKDPHPSLSQLGEGIQRCRRLAMLPPVQKSTVSIYGKGGRNYAHTHAAQAKYLPGAKSLRRAT